MTLTLTELALARHIRDLDAHESAERRAAKIEAMVGGMTLDEIVELMAAEAPNMSADQIEGATRVCASAEDLRRMTARVLS